MAAANKASQVHSLNRSLICYQPARIILLDTSSPFEEHAGKCLCNALENVFCIAANMLGPSRIPLVGIYMLTSYPEVIQPLSCTKGNFVRLHSALEDIRGFLEESLVHQQLKDPESSCIGQGILEACKQYKRYMSSLNQATAYFKQLELIVFTGHQGDLVQKQMMTMSDQVDLKDVKRVVSATLRYNISTTDDLNSSEMPIFDTLTDDLTGLVDLVTLECDQMSLQKFFYGWLIDTPAESEHVRILLPAPSPADSSLVIKCDLTERMLCPSQLPHSDSYSLHTEANVCKNIFPSPCKALGMTVPIYQLRVVCSLSRSTLCESVLFGMPLVAVPTACWKIDWEVLETNHQQFVSLCQELMKKDHVLLAQLEIPTSGKGTTNTNNTCWPSRTSAAAAPVKPAGYFVLLPSEQRSAPQELRSLLVKSIVSQELLLPSAQTLAANSSTEESDLRVQASLSHLETISSFNPLCYASGLFTSLKQSSLPKSAVDRARVNKRKVESLQNRVDGWGNSFDPSPSMIPSAGERFVGNHWSNPLVNCVKTSTNKVSCNQKSCR